MRATLSSLGFRRFSREGVKSGSSAAVLPIIEGQVVSIRTRVTRGEKRVTELEQLQPIDHHDLGMIGIAVLPQLEEEPPADAVAAFDKRMCAKGYITVINPGKGDVLLGKDGKIYGVDKHMLGMKDGVRQTFNLERDRDYLAKKKPGDRESIFEWLHGTGYISSQERTYPAINDGRVRGVLPDKDRARLEQGELGELRREKPECFRGITKDNLHSFITLVFDEGWYPVQAQEIMQERGEITAKKHLSEQPIIAGIPTADIVSGQSTGMRLPKVRRQ